MEAGSFDDWYRDTYRRVYASVLVVSGDRSATGDAVDEAFARACSIHVPRCASSRDPAPTSSSIT